MMNPACPKCNSNLITKNGIIKNKQRYKCIACNYNFTVQKMGRSVEPYFVVKALQLYIEGLNFREIERILGVSHVSVMNWVKKYQINVPRHVLSTPSYQVLDHEELSHFVANSNNVEGKGFLVTAIDDKFMVIQWKKAVMKA